VTLRQTGAVLGMQVVVFFLFVTCVIALLLNIIPEKEEYDAQGNSSSSSSDPFI